MHTNTHIYTCTHTYIQGLSFSHQKEWNFAIYNDVGRAKEYYAEWNESEKDKYSMWNLRDKTDGRRGREKKRRQTIIVGREVSGRGAKWVMGFKGGHLR